MLEILLIPWAWTKSIQQVFQTLIIARLKASLDVIFQSTLIYFTDHKVENW